MHLATQDAHLLNLNIERKAILFAWSIPGFTGNNNCVFDSFILNIVHINIVQILNE